MKRNKNGYRGVSRDILIVCFLLLLYSSAFCLCVSKKNVQIIKRKYIITNIDTQETDYSV